MQMQRRLEAGTYLPFRVLYAQVIGPLKFDMRVLAPDGSTVLGPDTGASGQVVQFSCDGWAAPAFPGFGQET